ncbi:hypothetical protein GCK72_024592 [Caenorhabditis remanei]|uniref:Uncharacterized protein n=1 Tax=Caenorhabditis remanei TaxID=31234 RepID=E3LDH7_CAERE|nr:hypothetical protein GCK72_024592 [Caenorhabditis remanei]EFO83080.1 hypothetical protein CRE_00622 [Caenorhabditis remanei]KAF1748125.1 hypothetical protein GCK72_024592 [Caenorhabditis remanei]
MDIKKQKEEDLRQIMLWKEVVSPFKRGLFTTTDWRINTKRPLYFREIPGYHAWNQFFFDVAPPIWPLTEAEHLGWCCWYQDMAAAQANDPPVNPLNPTPRFVMNWKARQCPDRFDVFAQGGPHLNIVHEDEFSMNSYFLFNLDYCPNWKEEQMNVLAFYCLVFMHQGVWEPIIPIEMTIAAQKLRSLCRVPLMKLFHIDRNPRCNNVRSVRSLYPLPWPQFDLERHVQLLTLWHKMMVDFVIYHYVVKKAQR